MLTRSSNSFERVGSEVPPNPSQSLPHEALPSHHEFATLPSREQCTRPNVRSDHGLATIFSALGVVVTAVTGGWAAWPAYQQRRTKKALEAGFGKKLFGPEVIERSTHYYVHPYCSNVDPGHEAEERQVITVKGDLLGTIDDYLNSGRHHILILADSGMGKTSFVLNYYAYNQRKIPKDRWRLAVVPLGHPEADTYIAAIENKEDTVIFLDAFDEDTQAITDYRQRLDGLMQACKVFKRIVITCRTQFFLKDEEISRKTGVIKFGPRNAGEGSEYEFWKLYLLPLEDNQVQQFLKKRYRFSPGERKQAWEIVEKIPLLSARPMLLTYIPDLLKSDEKITTATELYDIMVERWLEREERWVPNKDALRAFSEHLAVDIYVNRQARGGEHLPAQEIQPLAQQWNIPLEGWQLRGRSLLNRDAEGNFKFAHRSIMEYLFVKRLMAGDETCRGVELTDQMGAFLCELMFRRWSFTSDIYTLSHANRQKKIRIGATRDKAALERVAFVGANLVGANLGGADLRGALNLTSGD